MFGQLDPTQGQINPLALALMQGVGANGQVSQGPQPYPQGGTPTPLNAGMAQPPAMQAVAPNGVPRPMGSGGVQGALQAPGTPGQGVPPSPGPPVGTPPAVPFMGAGAAYGAPPPQPPFGFGTMMNGYVGGGY